MAANQRFYKTLNADLTPCHGGSGQWVVGEWMPAIKDPVPCERGYHVCRRQDLIHWLGPAIHPVEIRGERDVDDNKVVAAEALLRPAFDTWTERTARLLACDCAERVLPIYEKEYPEEKGPRKTIEVARRYANNEATDEELSAARAAARAAAGDAAGAGAAAWAAAWAAAGDAEKTWQTDRLFDYLEGRAG